MIFKKAAGFSHLPKCQICTHRFVLALDKLPDCPLLPYPSPWQTLLLPPPTYLLYSLLRLLPPDKIVTLFPLSPILGSLIEKPVDAHTRAPRNLPEISLIGDAAESGPHLPIRILPKTLTRTHRKQERSHTPTLCSIIRRLRLTKSHYLISILEQDDFRKLRQSRHVLKEAMSFSE